MYVLDIRNHGDSPHVSEMTFDLMARDTVQFLKERDTEKTVLIGHSLGGASAMYTTLKYVHVDPLGIVIGPSMTIIDLHGSLREWVWSLQVPSAGREAGCIGLLSRATAEAGQQCRSTARCSEGVGHQDFD